jgi:deoxyribonuclease V
VNAVKRNGARGEGEAEVLARATSIAGWPWPADPVLLERLQVALADLAQTVAAWTPSESEVVAAGAGREGEVALLPAELGVAGVYVTYPSGVGGPGEAGEPMWAGAVLLRAGQVVAEVEEEGQTGGPYLAGLLALRCGPLLERTVRALPQRPDLLIVDATGRDHPRRAGLALHLGAVLDVPTVGITSRTLVAQAAAVAKRRGAAAPLMLNGELVGYTVRTRSGVNAVHAHAAWRTTAQLALRAALTFTGKRRTPEPLRRARSIARAARAVGEGRFPPGQGALPAA